MSALVAASDSSAPAMRYELLDGLRGIAALAVMWFHITGVCEIFTRPPNAFLAVDFFFCLSGFVIAHAEASRPCRGQDIGSFMRRRAIRLMPLAVLGAGLGGCVLLVRSWACGDVVVVYALAAAGLNAVLLPSEGLVPAYPESFVANPSLWSLLQEMLASLAFTAILIRMKPSALAIFAVVAACILAWAGLAAGTLDLGPMPGTVWLGPVRVAFPFLCGVLIQRLPILSAFNEWIVALILAAALLSPANSVVGQILSVIMLFPIVVYCGARAQVGPRVGDACRWLGSLSYPLYALHYPIIRLVVLSADWANIRNPVLLAVAAGSLSIAGALIAQKFFEPPVRRWLSSRGTGAVHDRDVDRLVVTAN